MLKLNKTKNQIIQKADELGTEYAEKYKGCGQCTFMAILDSLRWGGYDLVPESTEDRLFSGICVLTGGVSMTGEGTCGAVSSSAICIGLALDIQPEQNDLNRFRAGCAIVRNTILDKYFKEYGSILCKDVQRKFFGKAWDLTSDEMSHEFLGITKGCTIQQTAKWTVEIIINELNKETNKEGSAVNSPDGEAFHV